MQKRAAGPPVAPRRRMESTKKPKKRTARSKKARTLLAVAAGLTIGLLAAIGCGDDPEMVTNDMQLRDMSHADMGHSDFGNPGWFD